MSAREEALAVQRLVDVLEPLDGPARERVLAAAQALLGGATPAKGGEALRGRTAAEWVADLVSHDGEARRDAVEAVRELGTRAHDELGRLAKGLREPEPWRRVMPAEALLQVGERVDEAAAAIVSALRGDPSLDVRRTALGSILKTGERAAAAVQGLIETLDAPEAQPGVHALAAEALGAIRAPARPAVPALRRALASARADVRQAALVALERIERG